MINTLLIIYSVFKLELKQKTNKQNLWIPDIFFLHWKECIYFHFVVDDQNEKKKDCEHNWNFMNFRSWKIRSLKYETLHWK